MGGVDVMDKLIDSIKHHEGCKLIPYQDTAGKMTIGFGRNLTDNGINLKEAEVLFQTDLANAIEDFWKLPFSVILNCNADRRRVLVEMLYNMGLSKLLGFTKMIGALEASDFQLAPDEMLDSKWAKQVGERSRRLANTMKTGVWWI